MPTKLTTIGARKFPTGGGHYGNYYQLSATRGIKVLDGESGDYFSTRKEALRSDFYEEAKEEAKLLRKAYKSGLTPKCYGVRLVKIGSSYAVGIEMEHIRGTTLENACINYSTKTDLERELKDALQENGITHGDLHWANIMYYRGKVKAIDFSPDHVTVR
jgi:tRNA A-37 threonylcarbamoyl transferase component Bud32